MTLPSVSIDDKYRLDARRIYLSGTQALVRLPLLQRARDRAQGLNTAGFISGYRGSPLGMYDQALWRAQKFLRENDISFVPGLNEDLAATSVWGTQQVGLSPGAKVQGVFAIWYGKGPGVDRSLDALKHANAAGTSPYGGVIAIAGDDHGAQSSTLPHQSEQVFAAASMPVVNPATLQEYLDYGLYGFALSRYSGCWVGFKATAEIVESSASIVSDPERIDIVIPGDFERPVGGLGIRWPDPPLEKERRLHGPKMDAVAAFARANDLDRVVLGGSSAWLGIVTTGKAYLDVCQALSDLGIDHQRACELGLRVYKIGLVWPIEQTKALRFADGLQEILVVEEKGDFLEAQLTRLLYNLSASRRPAIVGKRDETGARLLPSEGELTRTMIAVAVVARLHKLEHRDAQLENRLARLKTFEQALPSAGAGAQRTPFFCSGCPHNSSTKVPEGSRAMAGIGCHGMAVYVPSRRTTMMSHMGGEGASWIGEAPFTSEPHIFQNLGDGTYAHSGILALRAAAAAGVNITYKILYNDAVAMTGGQPVEGQLTLVQIAHQVAAEGAKRIAIVSDEPDKYPATSAFPTLTTIHHRRDLDAVQRELREIKGLTVLIYDQTCAAEKRRRRKRGLHPDPARRVIINEAVCEGCGDCSVASNCISVQPVETEFGRKRRIDQSQCNKDFACVEGFCPSFVTVHGGKPRRAASSVNAIAADSVDDLPLPRATMSADRYNILVTGIGGTGVITVGALIAMAAHLEGKGCSVLDVTGLAQKNGAVTSHIRIAARPDDITAARIPTGGADLILGCDIVVSASPAAVARINRGHTVAIINTDTQPTASLVMNPDGELDIGAKREILRGAIGDTKLDFIAATSIATALLGDAIAANTFLLGFAYQKGGIPLAAESLLRAIELNEVSVAANKQAFAWGRLAAHDVTKVGEVVRSRLPVERWQPKTLDELIARRAEFLTSYQNDAWADRYRRVVAAVREAEQRAAPGQESLAAAVAHNLFKLMAYKDEYEVARLHSSAAFREAIARQFDGDVRLSFHLAAPMLAGIDKVTGHPRKREYGAWMMSAFRVLAKLRFLRGTVLDPFGRSEERRAERRLIDEYEQRLLTRTAKFSAAQLPILVQLAKLPEMIRGYGHVKAKAMQRAATELVRLERELEQPESAS
ncbi:indolepyruvate ferredoxin oxidoreductase family protein [Peristeroidobacter soli]|uniref:indolepyruvate ferredoxin oxidoreductase family protein n=1 Tax=Peristeroidobacter soli TaxID=2497877 RepID=UPI00101D5A60|nr:indolepyruvate ferredoxin oxidoreductase family protein [Peristeroidobacter soli]